MPEPSMNDLNDPAFLAWLQKRSQMPIEPDAKDIDSKAKATTEAEQAHQWRLAQARKLQRLYREWKREQN